MYDQIWNTLGKFIGAAAMLALLTGAASAQLPMPSITLNPDGSRPVSPEEKEKRRPIRGAISVRRRRRHRSSASRAAAIWTNGRPLTDAATCHSDKSR